MHWRQYQYHHTSHGEIHGLANRCEESNAPVDHKLFGGLVMHQASFNIVLLLHLKIVLPLH